MSKKHPGRPPLDEPLSERVVVRLNKTQRARLEAIAAQGGQTVTAFIREAIDTNTADCSDRRIFS